MADLTKFEWKLIDDYMEPAYNDAVKGVSMLQIFIDHYDFNLSKPDEGSLNNIRNQWDTAGQVLFAIADYFYSIKEKLEEVILADPMSSIKPEQYAEQQAEQPQEAHISDKKEEYIQNMVAVLRNQSWRVLELTNNMLKNIAEK